VPLWHKLLFQIRLLIDSSLRLRLINPDGLVEFQEFLSHLFVVFDMYEEFPEMFCRYLDSDENDF
jgi:hypothetical protein